MSETTMKTAILQTNAMIATSKSKGFATFNKLSATYKKTPTADPANAP